MRNAFGYKYVLTLIDNIHNKMWKINVFYFYRVYSSKNKQHLNIKVKVS